MRTLQNHGKRQSETAEHYRGFTSSRAFESSHTLLLGLLFLALFGGLQASASADTVAYWRFDDMNDADISAAAGEALPDSDGQTVWRKAVHDWSGNGNHLTTWEYAWAGHEWSDDVPDTLVTTLGLENSLSITSVGGYPAMMTWSEESNPTGIDLETWSPAEFTIEASFKLTDISGYHTIVGRDGTDVATVNEEPALAPFYLSSRGGTGTLGVVMTDVDGYTHIVESAAGFIETDTWYNVAVVSDGSTLSLYCNNDLVNSVDMSDSGSSDTRLAVGETTGDGWESGTWTVTRGLYDGGHTDRVYGWVDEVRFSDVALSPNQFLFGKESARAQDPYPDHQDTDAAWDMILHWTSGAYESTHDLYFGASEEDLALLAGDLDVNSYDLGQLELGQTYYWRVDEVNVTSDHTVTKGDLWWFTVEPEGYAIDGNNIVATASSSGNQTDPNNTINESGLDENDKHGTNPQHMWASASDDEGPVWIEYAFDQIYSLHELWVWNSNQADVEAVLGLGIRNVMIEISTDGEAWTVFEPNTMIFPAAGTSAISVSSVFDMGGVRASHVRLTPLTNWSTIPGFAQYGLSEVRFYWIPTTARLPQPVDEATDVSVSGSLSWRSGRNVATHEVFFGTDHDAVESGDALVGQVDRPIFDLSDQAVTYGQTYYWRVDEINEAESIQRYTGEVWSYSTPSDLLVDDMEDYDADIAIFDTWVDGYEIDDNGSQVGHYDEPYVEQVIAYDGSQSMPYYYVNTASVISTAVRNMDHADWSQGELQKLVMYVLGVRENNGGTLYVEIDGERADCPLSLDVPVWTQWSIDLTSLNLDLSDIQEMVIGVDGVGNGLIYLDEIRLYHEAPATVTAQDPGQDGLVLWYELEENLNDSAGNYDGTTVEVLTYADSLTGLGQALSLNGLWDYVEMPIGELIAGLTDSSFTLWVNMNDSEASWQRAFDVGTGTDNYLFLCPRLGTDGVVRAAIVTPDSDGEALVSSPRVLASGWHHLGVVFDANTFSLYVDGTLAEQVTTPVVPADLGETTQNWLGDSQWEDDDWFDGLLDEFRIYNRALSEGEMRYLAGDQ